MNEETAERLTGIIIGMVSLTFAIMLWLWLYSAQNLFFDYLMVEAIVFFAFVALLVSTIAWALFRRRLTRLLFRPTHAVAAVGAGPKTAPPVAQAMVGAWMRSPRWLIPAVGASLLLLLFGCNLAGLLSVTVAFAAMAALTGTSLLVGFLTPDIEADDHRADLPITMVIVWAILYLIHASLFWPVLMGATWIAFIYGIGVALARSYSWWWILAGLGALGLINLSLFFALYRP